MTNAPDSALLGLLGESGQTVSKKDQDIRDRKVYDSDGRKIGGIADLLIDERERKVRFLLVEHGGFLGIGRTRTLIPVDDITAIDDKDVRIDHSKDRVAGGPTYDPGLVPNPVYQGYGYGPYGTAPYWGARYGEPPAR